MSNPHVNSGAVSARAECLLHSFFVLRLLASSRRAGGEDVLCLLVSACILLLPHVTHSGTFGTCRTLSVYWAFHKQSNPNTTSDVLWCSLVKPSPCVPRRTLLRQFVHSQQRLLPRLHPRTQCRAKHAMVQQGHLFATCAWGARSAATTPALVHLGVPYSTSG